jgi:hypothetical protein
MWSSDVQELLARIAVGQEEALGDGLIGRYLFGSLATGDFEPDVSDVDTVAVLRGDPSAGELAALAAFHRGLIEEMPAWHDRVEAVYVSVRALATFRKGASPAARISPGEPFHAIRVDRRWLIDWYQLRAGGMTLSGPPASSLVPPIPHREYVDAVREHILGWPELGEDAGPGEQSYAVLSMCRGLRTCHTGDPGSKREAARWACEVLPHDARLIGAALQWRVEARATPTAEGSRTVAATRRFIAEVQGLVAAGTFG